MTKNEAINKTIEMWTWLAETGKGKREYFKKMNINNAPVERCYLCQYVEDKSGIGGSERPCEKYCPYYQKYGLCVTYNSPYNKWTNFGIGSDLKKKYANEFLEQLKTLKEPDMNEIEIKLQQNEADIKKLQEEKEKLQKQLEEENIPKWLVARSERNDRIILNLSQLSKHSKVELAGALMKNYPWISFRLDFGFGAFGASGDKYEEQNGLKFYNDTEIIC